MELEDTFDATSCAPFVVSCILDVSTAEPGLTFLTMFGVPEDAEGAAFWVLIFGGGICPLEDCSGPDALTKEDFGPAAVDFVTDEDGRCQTLDADEEGVFVARAGPNMVPPTALKTTNRLTSGDTTPWAKILIV